MTPTTSPVGRAGVRLASGVFVLAAGLVGIPLSVMAQEPVQPPLTLTEALALAQSANLTLAAARLRAPLDRAVVAIARQRPNPDLLFETTRETPREALTMLLPIETGGKRGKRVDVAEAGVQTGEADIARVGIEIRNLVRRAYYGLVAAQRRAGMADELRVLTVRTRDTARERVDAGAAPRLELLQAELALAQANSEVNLAGGTLQASRASLNALIGRPVEATTTAGEDLDAGGVPSGDQALARAIGGSADVVLLDRLIAEAVLRVALARAQLTPDPIIQGSLTHRSPPDFTYGWRAGVSIALPLFTRYRAGVTLQEAAVARTRAEREAFVTQVRGSVSAAVAQASAQREQVLRYRNEILPQARQIEGMAEESYRAGQTGLVALLQALATARDVRVRAVQAGVDYQTALADLERAMGVPLP